MQLDYDKREDRQDWVFPDRYRVPRRSEPTKARGSHPCRICPSGCINPQQRLCPPWAPLHGAWSLPSQRPFEVQQKRLEKWAGEEGGKALDLGVRRRAGRALPSRARRRWSMRPALAYCSPYVPHGAMARRRARDLDELAGLSSQILVRCDACGRESVFLISEVIAHFRSRGLPLSLEVAPRYFVCRGPVGEPGVTGCGKRRAILMPTIVATPPPPPPAPAPLETRNPRRRRR